MNLLLSLTHNKGTPAGDLDIDLVLVTGGEGRLGWGGPLSEWVSYVMGGV